MCEVHGYLSCLKTQSSLTCVQYNAYLLCMFGIILVLFCWLSSYLRWLSFIFIFPDILHFGEILNLNVVKSEFW